MKTIKTANGSIKRVKDEEALRLVDNSDYFYCGKEEWKKEVRGPVRTSEVTTKAVTEILATKEGAKDDADN